ncbi:MAG: WbuC family cupin fold metalloprotein [Rhodocyclaceae bacterium]|nr:WbuC family cupin fold metalloprotein [Rhodocyclaceae bacterium]
MTIITTALLDEVSAEAAASARRRKNRNFHPADEASCHRLLNAIEPGSYVQPHRHLDPAKDECMIVVRGRLGIVFFDDQGQVTETALLEPGGAAVGVDIPHGRYHSVLSLAPGSVFLEAKAGPYAPLLPEEKSAWAPEEGAAGAPEYLGKLSALFGA